MRNLVLETKTATINVNSESYTVGVTDAEIVVMAENVKKECIKMLGTNPNAKSVVNATKHVTEAIEKVLGVGSVAKISGGNPVTLKRAIEWFNAITREVIAVLAEQLEDEQD